MQEPEHHMLHGICLRLIDGLDPKRPEALVVARWMSERTDAFGLLPLTIVASRRGPVLEAQGWQFLAMHLADRLAEMPEPHDTALARLDTIAAHLDLTFEETTILRHLALQHRQGPLADFAAMLQRDIGACQSARKTDPISASKIDVVDGPCPSLGAAAILGMIGAPCLDGP